MHLLIVIYWMFQVVMLYGDMAELTENTVSRIE